MVNAGGSCSEEGYLVLTREDCKPLLELSFRLQLLQPGKPLMYCGTLCRVMLAVFGRYIRESNAQTRLT